eukprot:Hpha_TRINITY_DN22646_c0_g1::TRINITY_DN22646_c0_g1_i1::g.192811::m.192811/K08582/CAPN15; calpain-15
MAEWNCPACTMLNADHAKRCTICNTPRGFNPPPQQPDPPAPASEGPRWKCEPCGYFNRSSRTACAACGEAKAGDGGDAAAAPWQCGYCTLLNDGTAPRCAACNHRKPKDEPLAATASSTASSMPPDVVVDDDDLCPHCNFVNPTGWTVCGMCSFDASRQGSFEAFLERTNSKRWKDRKDVETPRLSLEEQKEQWLKKVMNIEQQCGRGRKWSDPDFPPTDASLYGDRARERFCARDSGEKRVWKRPEDIKLPRGRTGAWKLAREVDGVLHMAAEDISQGELGDCWFLSALCVVCTRDDLSARLLISEQMSAAGVYCVRFWKDGEWTPVIIDDQLPTSSWGGIAFAGAGATHQYLWPALVEKAYAKLHGSYAAICSGVGRDALTDLTGAPSETIDLEPRTDDLDEFLVWARIQSLQNVGGLMSASCGKQGADKETYRKKGLITRHCYTLLRAMSGPAGVRLVELRNPWGKTEWNGDWSDQSPLWTAEARRDFGVVSADDGSFYMSFQDLLRYFSDIDLCKSNVEWFGHSVPGKFCRDYHPQGKTAQYSSQYVVRVDKPTWMYISVVQRDSRSQREGYQYKDAGMFVVRGDPAEDPLQKRPVASVLPQLGRLATCEVVMSEPGVYTVLPFSLGNKTETVPFMMAFWSSKRFKIDSVKKEYIRELSNAAQYSLVFPAPSGLNCAEEPKVEKPFDGDMFLYSLHGKYSMWFVIENRGTNRMTFEYQQDSTDSRNLVASRGALKVVDSVPPGSRQLVQVLIAEESGSWRWAARNKYRGSQEPETHQPPLCDDLHAVFRAPFEAPAVNAQQLKSRRRR